MELINVLDSYGIKLIRPLKSFIVQAMGGRVKILMLHYKSDVLD
jgi:hypothetical protein